MDHKAAVVKEKSQTFSAFPLLFNFLLDKDLRGNSVACPTLERDELETMAMFAEASPHAIFLLVGGKIKRCNQGAVRLFKSTDAPALTNTDLDSLIDTGWLNSQSGLMDWLHCDANHQPLFTGEERLINQTGEKFFGMVYGGSFWFRSRLLKVLVIEDISEKKNFEQKLHQRNQQNAAIAEFGQFAMGEPDISAVQKYAVTLTAAALSVEFAKVLEFRPESHDFLLVAGVGWKDGLVGSAIISAGAESQAGYTLSSNGPVIVSNLLTETRFSGPELLLDHQVMSGISVLMQIDQQPYGVLGAHSRQPQNFTHDDINFLEAMAGVLESAIRRTRTDIYLAKLANRLRVQHEIDQAILNSFPVDAIASVAITNLRGLLPCDYASVIAFNPYSQRLTILATESVLGKVPIFQANPLSKASRELIERLQQKRLSLEDLRQFEEMRPIVAELTALGINTFTSIPIRVEGELSGALNVGLCRGALDPQALEVIQELAGTLAIVFKHTAMVAAEEKRLNQLEAMHSIDQAIISHDSFQSSLPLVLEKVVSCCQVDAAVILLYVPETQSLQYGASKGFRDLRVESTIIKMGEGVAGKAAQQMRMIYAHNLEEVESDFFTNSWLQGEDFVAYYALPVIINEQLKGVLEVFNRTELSADPTWIEGLQSLGMQAAILIDNKGLFDGMEKANLDLLQAYNSTIEGWSLALDLRDKETEGHTLRVADMAVNFALYLGVSEDKIVHILRGSLLHDIGKVAVPDAILLKPGKLTEEEWEIMRQHPMHAYELLSHIDYLTPALDIPQYHHEKWDGTGYPYGLKGEAIPLAARLFALVDVFDALSSDRPYRNAWSRVDVLAYLSEQAGQHFDPDLVEAFLDFIETYEIDQTTIPNAVER